jgi:predicted DNA-binding ribbon-helix-helix protein
LVLIMSGEKMKSFEFEGKRRGIRLDAGTWQAIDWLAEQRGVKWSVLAREWASRGTDGPNRGENLTRVIRSAAVQALMKETVLAERADMHASAGPIWRSLGMCSDEWFDEALAQAEHIEGVQDFEGYTLHAGVSEFGNVAFYLRSNFRDGMNLIISTPIPVAQWAEAMEA